MKFTKCCTCSNIVPRMKTAQAILREELIVFEGRFKEAVKSQTPLLDRIMQFIVKRKGKQMRPIFVLVGDYLLTRGLLLSLDHNDIRVLQLLSNAVRLMSEGELLQIEKSRNLNLSETVYFEIIRSKTASLLAASCASGAFATSQDEALTEKMRLFGEKVGVAFQIKDDLFDYGTEN